MCICGAFRCGVWRRRRYATSFSRPAGRLTLKLAESPFPVDSRSLRESYRQGKWNLTKEEPSTWRRSVYTYWKRGLKYPMFEVHDQPDPNVTCERRNTTTVPTQALTLLNNEFVLVQARYFAERVMREAGTDGTARIRAFHRIALGREPAPKELDSFRAFLQKQTDYHTARSRMALNWPRLRIWHTS